MVDSVRFIVTKKVSYSAWLGFFFQENEAPEKSGFAKLVRLVAQALVASAASNGRIRAFMALSGVGLG